MSQKKTIIVSGGSRGLGLEICEMLLASGCRVATFARTKTAHVAKIETEFSSDFLFASVDSRNEHSINKFVESVHQQWGAIHGLVNNAAVGQDHLLAQIPVEKMDDILSINIRGPILLTKAVVKKMLLDDVAGRIVTISSICGSRGYTGLSVYSASKGAMDAFTRSVAREYGARNILINSVAPGFFLSEMSAVLAPRQVDAITRRTPTERLSDASDVLPVVKMLLLDNGNISGQVYAIDGGASI